MLGLSTCVQAADYVPYRPSPLSPRATNVQSSLPSSSHLMTPPKTPSSAAAAAKPYARRHGADRPVKANPLMQKQSASNGRETRRNLFLQKVRQAADERRWQARGGEDEMMRSMYLSEQKSWEDLQVRLAMEMAPLREEDEMEMIGEEAVESEPSPGTDLVPDEEQELDYLLSLLEDDGATAESQSHATGQRTTTSREETMGWSDEDGLDQLFLDVISSQQASNDAGDRAEESMDTSHG